MILPREISIVTEWLFLFGTAAWIASVPVLIRRRPKMLIALTVVWALALWQFRIRTGFGVLVLGGANHWVDRAAGTGTDREAAAILRTVLLSSNYGVNAAETAVLRRKDARERKRLFRLLAQVAPWENWRAIFAARAEGVSSPTSSSATAP